MYSFINQEDIYHLLISRTPMALSRALHHNFRAENITISKEQFSILVVLWKGDGCTQQYLSEQTFRDNPGVTRLLATLEKEKFIFRKNPANDKRTNLVFLTQKAKDLEEKVTQIVQKTICQAIYNFTEEEAKTLKYLLEKIFKNLQEAKNSN